MNEPADRESDSSDGRRRIEAACRFLEGRLEDDPPIEEVARAAHYSQFHFHRLFRGMTGETVRGYSRRLRLERAAHRLTHTDTDILAIALDSGYGSHEAFTRAFAKQLGVPPSEFRAAKQAVNTPAFEPSWPSIDVRIESREPCTVACVRHVGAYSDVGRTWKVLMKWGWAKMAFGKAVTFGLCYDDPDVTDPERVRYDACIVVMTDTRTKRAVELQKVAGGHFAVATHQGPYATLGETYAALFARVEAGPLHGRRWRLGDPPSLENYLNDPRKTKPEGLRTEVWMPVIG